MEKKMENTQRLLGKAMQFEKKRVWEINMRKRESQSDGDKKKKK